MKSGLLLAGLFVVLASLANGQTVRNTYRFYGDLAASVTDCGPDLTPAKALGSCSAGAAGGSFVSDALPYCSGAARTVYHTNLNWGLLYPNTTGTVTSTYTIQLYLKTTTWGSTYTRIIDFSNGRSDNGIYFKNTGGSADRCLNFYRNTSDPVGPCPFFNNATYYLLTFTRNGATGVIDVYVNDKLFVSYNDTANQYVGTAGVPIYIFRDDQAVPCESGEANFAYASFTNQYSSQADVNTVYKDICSIANTPASADFTITPQPVCSTTQNLTITYTGNLTPPGTGYSFGYDLDGGTLVPATGSGPTGMGPYVVKWPTGGTKTVTLTVTNTTCNTKATATKKAIIGSLGITASVQTGNCVSNTSGIITVRAVGGTAPYLYSSDSITFSNNALIPAVPKSYRVYVRDMTGCTSATTVVVDKPAPPPAPTARDVAVCAGQTLPSLTATGTAISWYSDSTAQIRLATGNSFKPTLTAGQSGTFVYYLTQSPSATCVSLPAKVRYIVYPLPNLQLAAQTSTGCFSDTPPDALTLDAGFYPATGYTWSTTTGSLLGTTQTIVVRQTGTYRIRVTDAQRCTKTDSVLVTEFCSPTLYAPDAFSPNSDGLNDVFELKGRLPTDLTLTIYNRWGEVVMTGSKGSWDGLYQGQPCPPGVYAWEVNLPQGLAQPSQPIKRSGQVLLVR